MRQHDFIWPRDEQMEREIELSRRIARRDARARRERQRRELIRDFAIGLGLMAVAVLLMWVLVPAWIQQ